MTIDQKMVLDLLHLGGQYLLPVAALLRALYAGIRGKFPEGFLQIAIASLFSGLIAVVGNQTLDWRGVILNILGNSVFMAGLLAFIVAYLLRQPNRGATFDGIVGGIIGLIVWLVWTLILLNDWPWWTLPLAIAAGAAGFIVLRTLLRQIFKLVRIATYFIVAGVLLMLGAGVIFAVQYVLANTPH